jgi:isopentenyl-diphosphate delta-isomerase
MEELVILVDERDRERGTAAKLAVHRSGQLHRAFSVFVFDAAGRLLLQRRAGAKYHSGGLWTNTCCGHPRPGEDVVSAAERRLKEEMGFGAPLKQVGAFTYRADVGSGLVEHELDHVLVGAFDGEPAPAPGEVDAWRWLAPQSVLAACAAHPARYTPWLAEALGVALRGRPAEGRPRRGGGGGR